MDLDFETNKQQCSIRARKVQQVATIIDGLPTLHANAIASHVSVTTDGLQSDVMPAAIPPQRVGYQI